MSATKEHLEKGVMPFVLRLLREADIHQCADIEREAFPSQFPPTSFRRELKNRMASYLVACARDEAGAGAAAAPQPSGERTLAGTLVRTARMLWDGGRADRDEGEDRVAGFLGTWYMVDEAHIVSVGVRRQHRGQGVGELLLIGAVEQALTRGIGVVTLEVRPSNAVARNLYRKYGFEDRGGGYVNRCVNDIRRRPSQPLIQWRFHPHTVHRGRRLRSTQGPSDA